MRKSEVALQARDETVPPGYGRLVSVSPLGTKGDEVILWFEDSSGSIRAIRTLCHVESGLGLEIVGQAMITRS
jgi:hypothetical protein